MFWAPSCSGRFFHMRKWTSAARLAYLVSIEFVCVMAKSRVDGGPAKPFDQRRIYITFMTVRARTAAFEISDWPDWVEAVWKRETRV